MATPEIQGKLLKATRWSAGDKGSLFFVQTVLLLQLLMLSHTTLGLLKEKLQDAWTHTNPVIRV